MKRPDQVLLFLAGFLLAAGLVLNLNVAMAQGRAAAPEEPPLAGEAGLAAPSGTTRASFTYQGRLTTDTGAPVNSPTLVLFKFHADDGSVLWSSAWRQITPTNGLFTVYLNEPPDPELYWWTLPEIASIGVTVLGDTEMTPSQPINTVIGHGYMGVVGSSTNAMGVYGKSIYSEGVYGVSDTATGVLGFSSHGTGVIGFSEQSYGVSASTQLTTSAALVAINEHNGPAVEIRGGIKVAGAGVNTNAPVFTHQVNAGKSCASGNYKTVIDNRYTNGRPDAILVVTPNYGPNNTGITPGRGIPGVFYDATNECGKGAGKWVIYYIDLVAPAMEDGSMFNVMVVNP